MQKKMRAEEKKYLARERRRRMWLKVVGALACVVVFCTTYALILPAIALEKEAEDTEIAEYYCGLEEHVHDESCYEVRLVCEAEQDDLDVGTEAADKNALTQNGENGAANVSESVKDSQENNAGGEIAETGQQEGEGQYYSVETVSAAELSETAGQTQGHVHSDECYQTEKILVCGEKEGEVHTHDDNCREEKLTCGQEESEGHTHDDSCYQTERVLVCEQEENEEHTHGDGCYQERQTLTCGKEESEGHTHTDSCRESVIICGKEEGNGHTHGDSCYELKKTLICGQEETKAPAETEENGSAAESTEPKEEVQDGTEEHVHTEECYEEVLICELEEHTHTLICYSNPEADVETAEDWEKTLPEELTGSWAEDLVAVAESQLGYAESKENYDVTEDEEIKGYTRYGAWYGAPYDDWDAMFVAFCLNYAEIPESAMPRSKDAQSWVEALNEWEEEPNDAAEETDSADEKTEEEKDGEALAEEDAEFDFSIKKEGYEPQAGDLVFFDLDEDGTADRMGIVAAYEEAGLLSKAKVKTIEGDSNDQVEYVTYGAEDAAIWGYVSMPENPEEMLTTLTYNGEGYTVTATFGKDAGLPEGTKLLAHAYSEDEKQFEMLAYTASYALGQDGRAMYALWPYEIHFEDESGVEIEPNGMINVEISYEEAISYQEGGSWSVFHITDTGNILDLLQTEDEELSFDGSVEELADANVEQRITEEGNEEVSAIAFETDHFSDFVLVNSDGIDTLDLDVTNLNDKTFAIVCGNGNNAMMASTVTYNQTATHMTAEKISVGFRRQEDGNWAAQGYSDDAITELNSSLEKYALWTFEQVNGNQYRIRTSDGKYLQANTNNGNLLLADIRNNASTFTVTLGTDDFEGQVCLTTGNGYRVNLYGSLAKNGFGIYYSGVASSTDKNEYFYLVQADSVLAVMPGTVEGTTPVGTTINLFDYWTTQQWPDSGDYAEGNKEEGINSYNDFHFTTGDETQLNSWTGSEAVRQGIVQNKLVDGYPVLSVTYGGESLAYLFDPENTTASAYRQTYRNVKDLLQVDSEGYYYYDCTQNYAQLDESTKEFTLYDTWGVYANGGGNGQFFPLNNYADVASYTAKSDKLNHYFGMTITARFIQQYNGHTDNSEDIPMTFEFSGDDDVWIFIDNVLVADLGGMHNAASVSIDFSTGSVIINDRTSNRIASTIKGAFDAADVAPTKGWNQVGNDFLFADNTYHTLKFFYLERGNVDSNLLLKYNLNQYPATSIYKVDQYGESVEGAVFAVYSANEDYNYLGADGTYYPAEALEGYGYGKEESNKWDIVDGNGNTVIPCKYYGVTNGEGTMTFVDENDTLYTLDDLQEMFGDYFILKEVSVPAGHRLVSEDIHLYIADGLLLCGNTYESGVWSSANLLVSAPNVVRLANGGDVELMIQNGDDSEPELKGTLFAVVLKYVGDGDPSNDTNMTSWAPVTGNDMEGYSVTDVSGYANNRDGYIKEIVKAAQASGGNTFAPTTSGAWEVSMGNFPGDIRTYYYQLLTHDRNLSTAQYTVAYYWTEGALANVESSNTYQVNADADGYRFSRAFGATIEVPNLTNRMFAQKLDEDGDKVNGATFALYAVSEDSNEIYYVADNNAFIYLYPDDGGTNDTAIADGIVAEGDNVGKAYLKGAPNTVGTYQIDSKTGNIAVEIAGTNYVIRPVAKEMTYASTALGNPSKEDGTATFSNLVSGTYYLREIAAPDIYRLNTTEVMVLVNDEAIYANAGTADDNVTVARGPGYVVSTMFQFASEGQLDNTLTWIYAKMRVSGENHSFQAFDDYNSWNYLSDVQGKDCVAHLVYNTEEGANTLFNYTLNTEWTAPEGSDDTDTGATVNTRRLYTDVGWSYYELYQDAYYGQPLAKKNGANYKILTEDETLEGQQIEIANLFSRSLYVQVTDEYKSSLTIRKVDMGDETKMLPDAEFTLTRTVGSGESAVTYYYVENSDGTAGWKDSSLEGVQATELTTDENGEIKIKTSLLEGTYTLKETKAPDGYNLLENAVTITVNNGVVAATGGATIEGTAPDYILVVRNSSGIALPNTGSTGTKPYTYGGLLLITAAMMCEYILRRKAKRRCEG